MSWLCSGTIRIEKLWNRALPHCRPLLKRSRATPMVGIGGQLLGHLPPKWQWRWAIRAVRRDRLKLVLRWRTRRSTSTGTKRIITGFWELCRPDCPANPLAGILVYGKKAKEALDKAVSMDPKSSQAFLAHGVGYYYLPENFGGGPGRQRFSEGDSAGSEIGRRLPLDGDSAAQAEPACKGARGTGQSLALDPDRIWTKQQLAKTPEK